MHEALPGVRGTEVGTPPNGCAEVTSIVEPAAAARRSHCYTCDVKRASTRAWPKGIVEVSSPGLDARADPQATQKISREQLEEALKRTKSGTRPVVRSEPSLDDQGYAGPRDDSHDSPQVTIARIDSVEVETIDPSSLPPPSAMPVIVTTPMDAGISLARPASGAQPMAAPFGGSTVATAAERDAGADDRSSGPRVIDRRRAPAQRLQITPRMAFVAGMTVAVIVALAAFLGFFAGRGLPSLR